jgi:two-component system, chemotaxis family, CheB/CheR fusion protein
MELRELVEHLAAKRNLDLRGYKPSSLERRFRHRMFQLKLPDYDAYARFIAKHPGETNELLNAVLINVTRFFRDPQVWDLLQHQVLPELCERLKPGDTFRAWCPGCATGEEPYSLCILLAEYFGEKLPEYGIKVYGTDIDLPALAVARRAEYSREALQHVPAHWREKYFTGGKLYRLKREVRRMAIFGGSNLVSDAPISHVRLVICRNLLIYFDAYLQKDILRRLHYSLEPDGILILGKAETQLSQSSLFDVVDAKWRIFRRADSQAPSRPAKLGDIPLARAHPDQSLLQLYYDSLLETLQPGVLILNQESKVVSHNEAVLRLWGLSKTLQGRRLAETELVQRCPELLPKLASVDSEPIRFETAATADGSDPRTLAITLKPVRDPRGARVGCVLYTEDVTPRRKLQSTISELEDTGGKLQSTNEELETTNEELQSTNEELETTNEELQSTNEELETTNEELQALNEELGTTNEELEARTRELDTLNDRYLETLERLPWPVLLVDANQVLHFWNTAAVHMFGLAAKSVVGLQLDQLPLQQSFRNVLTRRSREVLLARRPRRLRGLEIELNDFRGSVDAQFIPLAHGTDHESVLVVLEPPGADVAAFKKATSGNSRGARKVKTRRPAKRRRK